MTTVHFENVAGRVLSFGTSDRHIEFIRSKGGTTSFPASELNDVSVSEFTDADNVTTTSVSSDILSVDVRGTPDDVYALLTHMATSRHDEDTACLSVDCAVTGSGGVAIDTPVVVSIAAIGGFISAESVVIDAETGRRGVRLIFERRTFIVTSALNDVIELLVQNRLISMPAHFDQRRVD